jgi:hypothetical protein
MIHRLRSFWRRLCLWVRRTPTPAPLARVPPHEQSEPGTTPGDRIESLRMVTVNGLPIVEVAGGTVALLGADGSVRELERVALALLGDGTLTDRLTGAPLARCDACARLAARSALTPSQGLLASLHRADTLMRSTATGELLCARHRRTVSSPEGPIVLSLEEAQAIAEQERLRKPLALLGRLFLEPSGG